MAGLNFVGNAAYAEPVDGMQNVAQFEFIPLDLKPVRNYSGGPRSACPA